MNPKDPRNPIRLNASSSSYKGYEQGYLYLEGMYDEKLVWIDLTKEKPKEQTIAENVDSVLYFDDFALYTVKDQPIDANGQMYTKKLYAVQMDKMAPNPNFSSITS